MTTSSRRFPDTRDCPPAALSKTCPMDTQKCVLLLSLNLCTLSFSISLIIYLEIYYTCISYIILLAFEQITWVEHAEIEEKPVHQILSHYIYSGMAFGAQRWLAILQRQCERVASLMARNISDLGG